MMIGASMRLSEKIGDDCSLAVSFGNGEMLGVNAHLNEIAKAADVQVIRSGLYANMANRRVGPRALRNRSSSRDKR